MVTLEEETLSESHAQVETTESRMPMEWGKAKVVSVSSSSVSSQVYETNNGMNSAPLLEQSSVVVSDSTSSPHSISIANGYAGSFVGLLYRPAKRPDHDDDSDGTHGVTKNTRLSSPSSKATGASRGEHPDGQEQQQHREISIGTESNNNTTPPLAKKVSFGTISIREYPICVGDNPGGSWGVPITIDWEHQSEASFDFDMYETTRPERRTQLEIAMPAPVRYEKLRAEGFSRQEIQKAEKQANIIRCRRRRTVEMLHMAPIHEFSETIVKGTVKALSLRKKKKNKDEFHFSTTTLYDMEKKQPTGEARLPSAKQPNAKSTRRSMSTSLIPRRKTMDASSRTTSESSLASLDESVSGRFRNFGSAARVTCS